MRFLPSVPREPLARFRLMALWFALFVCAMNTAMVPVLRGWNRGALLGATASVVLAAWWTWGYRRRGWPVWGWGVDLALLVLCSATSPIPLRGLGIFFAGVQLRALFVSRRQLPWLPLSYGIARVLSVALWPLSGLGATSPATAFQIIGLSVIAVTLQLFVSALDRQTETESALKRSDERYRLLAAATRDVFYDWDLTTNRVEWSETLTSVLGYDPATATATDNFWGTCVHPDDREAFTETVQRFLADPSDATNTAKYRVRKADGTTVYVVGNALLQRDATGAPARVMGTIRDITDEQQLADQLRQSQKMEAVGQLAGGVAHDFNNLLTVIGGHVYMLEQKLGPGPVLDRHLGGITATTKRAAELTKQLLAFSRKQILKPSVMNPNAIVNEVIQMLRPTLGEHIHIGKSLDPFLSPVLADANQVSQVLVNLAINARDAMPSGGTLTIETRNAMLEDGDDELLATGLPSGEYIRIVVRDTGIGMDDATLRRAFEPFFTTKPPGAGTGLGLATSYGIIKQSSGDIRAVSAPGEGAAFTILLPSAKRIAEPAPSGIPSVEVRAPIAAQHVLLVEDDDGVREFAREVLLGAGYTVHEARNGAEGIEVAQRNPQTDLVVTDVVMPRMGGREMADHLRRLRPGLRVLFMTGYTDDVQMLGELRAKNARLLEKPFTARALTRAVADAAVG